MQFTETNKYKNTLLVDETSMIGDDRQNTKLFENGSLLGDLMQYVDAGTNMSYTVGDPAVTSVHLDLSPALDAEHLNYAFNKVIECFGGSGATKNRFGDLGQCHSFA